MSTWTEDRIAALRVRIEAYEAAVDALASGVEEYTLDTGQTKQRVRRQNALELEQAIDKMYQRLASLEARSGKPSHTGRPAW